MTIRPSQLFTDLKEIHMPTIRRTAAAIIAAAASLSMLVTAPAASAHGLATQHFTLLFSTQNGVEKQSLAIAKGPITGVGIETQTEEEAGDQQTSYAVMHLPRGDVAVTFLETFAWTINYRACAAHGTGSGTFTITGGTGAYTGATGQGTFTDRGTLIGARDSQGQCLGPDSSVPPKLIRVRVHATGDASAPSI